MEAWLGLFRLLVEDEVLAGKHGWEGGHGAYVWHAAMAADYQAFVDTVREAVAPEGLRIDDVADADPVTALRERDSLSPTLAGLAAAAEASGGVWAGTQHMYPLDAPDEEETSEIEKFVEDEADGIRHAHRLTLDEPSVEEKEEGIPFQMEADPYRNLSPGLAESLERFVLIPEWRLALSRMVALWILLGEVWPEDGSSEPERRAWIEAHSGRRLRLGADDEGHYVLDHDAAREWMPEADIPPELVDVLVREVLDRPGDDRVTRRESVQDLLREWNRCLVDSEKLTGHLMMGHDSTVVGGEPYEALVRRHSQLHLDTSPT